LLVPPNPENQRYLQTKADKLGHLMVDDEYVKSAEQERIT
jgi:hypothetical protein